MDVDLDHPAIAGYLGRLEAAACGLPDWRRDELVAEIRSHLNEALLSAADGDDAAVYAAVDRLGDPADIVAAEGGAATGHGAGPGAPPYGSAPSGPAPYGSAPPDAPAFGAPPGGLPPGAGWQQLPGAPQRGLGAGWGPVELIAVIGLAVGVLTGGIGLLAGLICTWISDRWTTREKVVATVLSSVVLVTVIVPLMLFVVFARGTTSGGSATVDNAPAPVVESAVPTPGGTP